MTSSPSPDGTAPITVRFRLLGLLPLAFFISHLIFYVINGGVDNMLWMCNVGNLLLAAGLFLGSGWMIRLATIWLAPGLPLWFYYVAITGGFLITSFFTHIGALMVGLIAMRKVRAARWTWLYAFGWYLVIQQLSRSVTPPFWNVNVAHSIYPGWESAFDGYWEFWLATSALTLAGLWVLGFAMLKMFPPRRDMNTASRGARLR